MGKFEELYQLNVNDKTEEKNGLTYLSWPYAWATFKKTYPQAEYEVVKFDGKPYAFDPATGYMVYTKVTAEGVTHEMWLPVMDGANKAMKAEPYEYTVYNKNFKYAKLAEDGKYRDKYGNEQPEFLVKKCEAATMFDINKAIMRCLVKNLAMFGLGLYIYAGEDLPDEIKEPPVEVTCPKCGKIVKAQRGKGGKMTQPADILKACGGQCYDCFQAAKNGGDIFTAPEQLGEAK